MKKLTLILSLVLLNALLFASDYREVIFGNNWANINEISDDETVNALKKDYGIVNYNEKYFLLYEEKYENGTVYRLIASWKPFTTYEKDSSATFMYWTDLLNESYFQLRDNGLYLFKYESGITEISIKYSFPLIEENHPFKYTIQNAIDGNPATSFVEDTEDNKIFMDYYLDESKCTKIKIINGYAQNKNLYMNNNRVKTLESSESDRTQVLKDGTLEEQIFDWDSSDFNSKDLYKGKKYNDTCIAEVDFLLDSGKWLFGDEK